MKKYSKETVLALSLIGAGVGYMLSDKYSKYGKIGTLGFMFGGMALGFGIGNLITNKISKSEPEVLPKLPEPEMPESIEAVGSAE